MSTAQKIGVAFVLILVVGYFSYTTYRDGGFGPLEERFSGMPAMVPVNSVEPSASTSAQVITTPSGEPAAVPAVSLHPSPPSRLDDIFAAMNAQRVTAGAESLRMHPVLASLAQQHANDMAAKGYFSHVSPVGVTFEQRISKSGYGGTSSAENIGLTSNDALTIIDGWMGSEGHRVNLLNTSYVSVGVGAAYGTWQGMSVIFVVAVFGSEK